MAALPANLVRNIRSREARLEFVSNPGLLSWIALSAHDQKIALALERLLPAVEAILNGARGEASEELNKARAAEYAALFKPEKLSPSNNEIPLDICCALLRSFCLQPSDRFMDLGSARGRLVFAAAASTHCAACGGVELSPSDHAAAIEARTRFAAADSGFAGCADRLPQFYCCDLRAAPLREYNVFYCAIRGDASRPRVVAELVQRMVEAPLPEGARPPRRLILAGFGIDLEGKEYQARVKLVRVYALQAAFTDEAETLHQAPDSPVPSEMEPMAMYGDSQGPRFLLEYHIL